MAYYKAFRKGMICMGKQYAENTDFEEQGADKCCAAGMMHFCKEPMDVLNYYPLVDEHGDFSEFATVEPLEKVIESGDKCASKKIHIGTKLGLKGFIEAIVNVLIEKTKDKDKSDNFGRISSSDYHAQISSSDNSTWISSSGDYAQISSSGDCTRISSSGHCAQIGSSGDYGQIDSSGYCTRIGSSGYHTQIGSKGDRVQIGSSAYDAKIGSSGDNAQICSSGDGALIGSSGYNAQICSSGNGAHIGSSGSHALISSSGNYAQIGSSGSDARIGSSGYDAKIGSSGNYTQIGSSGNYTQIGSSGSGARIGSSGDCARIKMGGVRSVAACVGDNGAIKGKIGCWIVLAEWKMMNNEYTPVRVKAAKIDGKKLKEDTFYQLKNGKFVEVDE